MHLHSFTAPSPLLWKYRYLLFVACITSLSVAFGQVNKARDLVDPFIGTGGHGHTFPGACVPNGLVQLSPDTRTDGVMDWDGCGGYHYSDSSIYGFSHTHLSGTGVADLCDVLLMPMSGNFSFNPIEYRSNYQHASENASAGYYSVYLEDEKTKVELTATPHCGIHRYTFPSGKDAWVVLDLEHRDELLDERIEVRGDQLVHGMRRSKSWASDQHLYYAIEFSRPFKEHRLEPEMTRIDDVIIPLPTQGAFRFEASEEPLLIKVGISATSVKGAWANLDAEVPGWDFDGVRKQAEDAWNAKLNKIEVDGGTKEQQRVFYTALYHCYVAPYIFNDVDGNYRGMDGKVHHADHKVYTVFSLWDTYRALHPLMTILEPEMTSDWIKTFLLHYQQTGRLPVWELWGNETDCMIGYHSASVIADAYVKGIRGFDADLALEAMLASAMRDEPGLNAYRKQGYISSEDQSESVSKTLEYAYDDWCIAQMAEHMKGEKDLPIIRTTYLDSIFQVFTGRSYNYQNLFNPKTHFFQARSNGGFKEPFDPFEVNFNFTEANAWQYSLAVQQGKQYLIDLFSTGKTSKLSDHLDKLFTAESATTGRDQADITGLIGQYAHGNEPSHHMAYLYNAVGQPQRTAELVHRICTELYHDAPDGLSGNEDCGQMSAWYVLSAMGFYQVSPGNPWYEGGSPLFNKIRVDVGNGKFFTLNADRKDPSDYFVQAKTSEGWNLSYEQIMRGDEVTLEMTKAVDPEKHDAQSVLVSPSVRPSAVPFIQASSRTFSDSLRITLDCLNGRSFNYTVNNGVEVTVPSGPVSFTLYADATISAYNSPSPVMATFTKHSTDLTLTLQSEYANQYAAGGANALVDGLRGSTDFRTGEWQGYEGKDLLATIDLGKPRTIKRIGLSVLQDQKSWIWFPAEVQFVFSTNQRQWSTVSVVNDVPHNTEGPLTKELWTEPIAKKARYIKVIAKNAGPCPEWHPGKGGKTWIFADEVLLEVE